jgi:hypothetical protein
MSGYDTWKTTDRDAEDRARAEYLEAHTCSECGEVVAQLLTDDERCLSCCARECVA